MFTLTLLLALTPARLPQAPCLRQAELPPRPLTAAQRREIVARVQVHLATRVGSCGDIGCDCGCQMGLLCTCASRSKTRPAQGVPARPMTYRPAPPMVFSGGFMAGGAGGACRGGS